MPFIRLSDDGTSLQPLYSINCSALKLYSLPTFIPENTTIFYANHNNITSVEPLQNIYRLVLDMYLDYNLIESIDILDTAYWLQHFRIFSLKGNKLTKVYLAILNLTIINKCINILLRSQIPIYVFDNALEKNRNAVRVFFSENPWQCNCIFTLRFRQLLMKYHTVIKDSANISCKYIESEFDKELAEPLVLSLKYGDVCTLPPDYKILALGLLNIVLATLIVMVLSKLAYDYYNYRKFGKLPWIATKLP